MQLTKQFVGRKVRIKNCEHAAVAQGASGKIVDYIPIHSGYGVKTGELVVFVEAKNLELFYKKRK